MAYVNIIKPTDATYTNVTKASSDYSLYGSAIYGVSTYGSTNNYTNVNKPTGSSYTKISKPT